MIERLLSLVQAAISEAGSTLPVFCGFVPPANVADVDSCVLIRRTDIVEVGIECRAPDCFASSRIADVILRKLDSAGIVREIVERYDSPGDTLSHIATHLVIGL